MAELERHRSADAARLDALAVQGVIRHPDK